MLKRLARLILRLTGWELVGEPPSVPKAVVIAAHHTSNWDGVWMITAKIALGIEMRFLAKHTLFWWPLGAILRASGAISLDRGSSADTVAQMARAFAREERLLLALAPEGTRGHRPYWKTGFYRIARAANVPIVLTFLDYGSKRMGIGPTLPAGLGRDETLAALREFYALQVPRHPEKKGPIEFPPAKTTVAEPSERPVA